MSGLSDLLSRLPNVSARGKHQWMSCCSAHQDKTPSLSIKENPDGTILLHCFAGCDSSDILAAVGMTIRDLFPAPRARHLTKKRMGVSSFDALRAVRHEVLVMAFIAEDIAKGQTNPDLCRRSQLAAERIRMALALCDG